MGTFAGCIPTGTINGVNRTFTITINSNPITSFEFYKNGLLLQSSEYSWAQASGTATITLTDPPRSGDSLNSWIFQ